MKTDTIIRLCQKCDNENAVFTPHSRTMSGKPHYRSICNKCQTAKRRKQPSQRKVKVPMIKTDGMRPDGYTSCACCNMISRCKASVSRGGPIACEPSVGLAEPGGRARWDMDGHIKRLGWDKLPALGD